MTTTDDTKAATDDKTVLESSVTISGQWPALAQVADQCELSRSQLQDAAEKGAVWLQRSVRKGQLAKPVRLRSFADSVSAGDIVLVNFNSQVLAESAGIAKLISDQKNYSIWYKPRGMLSQGTRWSDHCSIARVVELTAGKNTFLVHRLDKAAGGLMILAHTRLAASAAEEDSFTHLLLRIATGRKHQIRSHLASIGYPVVGDRLFDSEREHVDDLQLNAIAVRFTCPFTEKELHITLPDDLHQWPGELNNVQ